MNARHAAPFLAALFVTACASGSGGPSTAGNGTTTSASSDAATAGATTSAAAPPGTTTSTSSAPTTTSTATETGDRLTGPYVLTFRQTGGIAGLNMATVLDSAAKTMTYGGPRNQKPESREVTPQEVADVARLIDDAGLSNFRGAIPGSPPADAFTYQIDLVSGGKSRNVRWTDGTTVPVGIEALRIALSKLREQKFSGPPKDAPIK